MQQVPRVLVRHGTRLGQVVVRGGAAIAGGDEHAVDDKGTYLRDDECTDAARIVSRAMVMDDYQVGDTHMEVAALSKCKIAPAVFRLGEELSRDKRVQDAVLDHFRNRKPAKKDVIEYLNKTVHRLRDDLEEQQDLNQDLILFQDNLQEKMAEMERKNRELERELAKAKAQQQRTSEASFAYIMGVEQPVGSSAPTGLTIALVPDHPAAAAGSANETARTLQRITTRMNMKFQPLFITLLLVMTSCSAFRPQSEVQLQAAVRECIETSPIRDCPEGQHGPIGDWDVSAVTDMRDMFHSASDFDQDLSKWDVSAVTNMGSMFSYASAFNQDLSKWDVSAVTNMGSMFFYSSSFNQDLSKWDVSAVANMGSMFLGASAINQDLSKWDVSAVTNMMCMFERASTFNQDLSKWDVPVVTNMMCMFERASTFNQDLSKWDVSAVTKMGRIFSAASTFNQDLSKWDVSAVTHMWFMFSRASAFNQDLSKWDVSKVTDMAHMFSEASTFNQDLSKWDVSVVTDMEHMFYGAQAFNRELCGDAWVNSKAYKKDMFSGSPGSISSTVCTTAKHAYAFQPQTKTELQDAVQTCGC